MFGFKKLVFILVVLGCISSLFAAKPETEETFEEVPTDGLCFSVATTMMLPGNGNALRRAGAAELRGLYYTAPDFAIEGSLLYVPAIVADHLGNGALGGASLRGLYHLGGYERLDPFVTLGVSALFGGRHVFADGTSRFGIGPEVGIGCFYYLTEQLSVRLDSRAVMTVDSPCGMVYSLSAGLQWSFGEL